VATLKSLGAVLVGKTQMTELGMSPLGINHKLGTPRNPWNIDHLCGGSSSGSGAAVGAGLVPFALGNDTGGSVRTPAALCGCAALIASYHRITVQGPCSCVHSAGQTGPLASCIRDVALVYSAIADAGAAPLVAPPLVAAQRPGGLRDVMVGLYRPWFEDCHKDVAQACYRAVDALRACGARLHAAPITSMDATKTSLCTLVTRYPVSRPGTKQSVLAQAPRLWGLRCLTWSSAAWLTR
jgi:Asp-tRNA(Asn)/Glu-tRNA(Gln) amidotransferase A subunit family amidase